MCFIIYFSSMEAVACVLDMLKVCVSFSVNCQAIQPLPVFLLFSLSPCFVKRNPVSMMKVFNIFVFLLCHSFFDFVGIFFQQVLIHGSFHVWLPAFESFLEKPSYFEFMFLWFCLLHLSLSSIWSFDIKCEE